MVTSCSYTDRDQYTTTVVTEQRVHVTNALIVPVVEGSRGVVVEGGTEMIDKYRVTAAKPFEWNSGADLMPRALKSSEVQILPMAVSVGKDIEIKKWLLLKKGYKPLLIENNKNNVYRIAGVYGLLGPSGDQNAPVKMISTPKAREAVMAKSPRFVLKPGGDLERRRVINMLITVPPDRKGLSEVFGISIEGVDLGMSSRKLLKAQE